MTKHYNNKPNPYVDTPIPISEEYTRPDNDKTQYVCSYCQCNLAKINEEEWYCNRCSLFQYPNIESVRSKSRISTPIGLNMEPLVSYTEDPDARFFKDKTPEPKGGFKALKDRGIRITSYKEGYG